MDDIELVTLDEARRALGVSRAKLYELLPSLDARKLGHKTMITRVSLREFVASLPRFCSAAKHASSQPVAA